MQSPNHPITHSPNLFWFRKTVRWSDTDAAGIAWFPNFFGWFEDAEEEIYTLTLGRTRQSILDELDFAMPRVEASAKYRSPVRAGEVIRIGIRSIIENPRRLRHEFEMREEKSGRVIAEGFVRVASASLSTFTPRDFPNEVYQMVEAQQSAASRQTDDTLTWV